MKKFLWSLLVLLTISVVSFSFTGCNKEEDEDCSCGVVVSDGADYGGYWLGVRNDCTGNVDYFYVDYYDWLVTYTGDWICFTNVSGWKKTTPADPSTGKPPRENIQIE